MLDVCEEATMPPATASREMIMLSQGTDAVPFPGGVVESDWGNAAASAPYELDPFSGEAPMPRGGTADENGLPLEAKRNPGSRSQQSLSLSPNFPQSGDRVGVRGNSPKKNSFSKEAPSI